MPVDSQGANKTLSQSEVVHGIKPATASHRSDKGCAVLHYGQVGYSLERRNGGSART